MAVKQTSKSATFNAMLNEYLPYDLLMREMQERNWLLKTANIKEGWDGSDLIIPYQSSGASSVKMGGLTAEDDIDTASYVRGKLTGYKECWATLLFNSRDLMEHDKVSETNFLRILPDQLDETLNFMKEIVSTAVLNVKEVTSLAATPADAASVIKVYHPERLWIGQKIQVRLAANTAQVTVYVLSINMNNGDISVSDTRGGAPVTTINWTTDGYAAEDNVYIPDTFNDQTTTNDNGFSSLLHQVLPDGVLGAPDSVFGQVKTSSPFTQGLYYDARSLIVDSTDVLAEIFNGFAKARQRKAEIDCFLVSFKTFSAVLAALEYGAGGKTLGSGAFKNVGDKVDYAGFSEITVGSVLGSMKIVAINEFTDKLALGINTKKLDFHTNRGFQIQESPDGLKFYSIRTESGYQYIVDYSFYGDFVYSCPWQSIAVHLPDSYTGMPNFLI
jgi:hypothetical protein